MVEDGIFPIPFGMAGLAFLSELAFVLVVLFMAGIAGSWGFGFCNRFFVTPLTFCRGVFSYEGIFRVFIMIKSDDFPSFGRVTLFAFQPKHPFMIVILFMATVTIPRGAFESLIFVAIVTGCVIMLA